MTIERPMFPDRRGFLTLAARASVVAAAVVSQPAFAAPEKTLDAPEASAALRDAVDALRESHDRLEAAKAKFIADDARMAEWSELNPEPKGKRAQRKYWNRWRDVRGVTVDESWAAQLDAEKDFHAHQIAVAQVVPRDENDLACKAAAAAVYDKERGAYGMNVAVISYSVALDLIKMRLPTT